MPTIFQSITAFFTGGLPIQRDNGKHAHLRRDEAILSVDDAFSIPAGTSYNLVFFFFCFFCKAFGFTIIPFF